MTDPAQEGQWPIGSVANDHLRTSDGWIQLARKSRADGPPWSPGDVVDGHVMTETGTWVSTDATHPEAAGPPLHPLAAPPATLQQRWQRLSLAAKMERLGWAQVTNGLWARWDSPDGEGNIMGVTWKMRVVSPEGCPNGVYVEANVLDTSGTVVGFTNAMLPSLGANSQALMELSTATGEQRVSLEPTKASCY